MICTRCGKREALDGRLICYACVERRKRRPRVRMHDRAPTAPELDFWRIAHELLYPSLRYRDLSKPQRFRIVVVARYLAAIPYREPAPSIDAEALHLAYQWLAQHPDIAKRHPEHLHSSALLPED